MQIDLARVRALNDNFRKTFAGGLVMLTESVQALSAEDRSILLAKVRSFDSFTDDNDPHQEHDFGEVVVQNDRYFFKLDYFDRSLDSHSEDPSDPSKTTRVLTIMRAEEY